MWHFSMFGDVASPLFHAAADTVEDPKDLLVEPENKYKARRPLSQGPRTTHSSRLRQRLAGTKGSAYDSDSTEEDPIVRKAAQVCIHNPMPSTCYTAHRL